MTREIHSRSHYHPLLLAACLVFNGRCFLAQNNTPEKPPAWRYEVPAAGANTEDPRTPAETKTEDDYFDSHIGASDPLDSPQRARFGASGHAYFNEDFPTRFRDEIAVAHFTTWVSHLSNSRRSIYTTVNLQVDRVVVDKGGHITAGSIIPLIVPGGTVLRPTPFAQPLLSYEIRASDFPLLANTKYLIFLDHQPGLPFYGYVKAWSVDRGVLEPTTPYDAERLSTGHSTYGGKSLESAISALTSH